MPKIATESDKIVGTDTHIVMVPNPGGATPTPLPHPFQGTIREGCAGLTINGRPIAVTGCSGANDTPHTPTPPGTTFQKPPSNKARVITSAMPLFEIDGKPIVVEGSPAITCNDPVDAPTGMVKVIHPDTWTIEPNYEFKPTLVHDFEKEAMVKDLHQHLEKIRDEKVQSMPASPYKQRLSEEFEIESIQIHNDPLYFYEKIRITIRKKGIPIAPIYLRMYLVDAEGNIVNTGMERRIWILDSEPKQLRATFPPVIPGKREGIHMQRLFVGFEVYCQGKPFRLLKQDELKEVFYRGKINLSTIYFYIISQFGKDFSPKDLKIEITEGCENDMEFLETGPLILIARKVHCSAFKIIYPILLEVNPFEDPKTYLFSPLDITGDWNAKENETPFGR